MSRRVPRFWYRLIWFLDEDINHKIPGRQGHRLSKRLCDYNDRLIIGGDSSWEDLP